MPRKDPRHPGPAAPQALPLLLALAGAGVVMSQQRFALPQPLSIDNIAATGDSLLLAGGNCLYKLSPSLQEQLGLRLLEGAQNCTHPAGTRNKLLLPDLQGDRLLTGWTLHGGSCQVRQLSDLQPQTNQSEVVSCLPQGSTTGLLFAPLEDTERYLALAAAYQVPKVKTICVSSVSDANTALTMRRLQDLSLTSGDSATVKRKEPPLHFVDAFLWDKHLFFPYYPLGEAEAQPSVALLRIPEKSALVFNHFGEVRLDCGGRGILLSSSLLGAEGWWAGVFSTKQSDRSWNSTALCIFSTQEMVNHSGTTGSNCRDQMIINESPNCVSLPLTSLKRPAELAPAKIPVRKPLDARGILSRSPRPGTWLYREWLELCVSSRHCVVAGP